MKIKVKGFRVREGEKVRLKERPTQVEPFYKSKKQYERKLAGHIEDLSARQAVMSAHNRYALLLIFQAMDAGGKDGAIKHVMSGVNPQGCQVYSFRRPSSEELDHDFLWRTVRRLPERGSIGIFNRSYYEEVLIVRVHPEILRGQRLPREILKGRDLWKDRYRSILDLEKHLYRNGTRVVKFFLHVSREEQRRRFLARIDDPDKNWKLTREDLSERGYWTHYMKAYEDCLSATSTRHAPWYVVPADDKNNARLIVSEVILDTMKALRMSYPKASAAHRKELRAVRKLLEK